MTNATAINIAADVPLCQVTDTMGRLILVPQATLDHIRQHGGGQIVINVEPLEAVTWLTLTEAAEMYRKDIDGELSLQAVRMRIKRACDKQRIKTRPGKQGREIEPISFDAWRKRQSDKQLDDLDDWSAGRSG